MSLDSAGGDELEPITPREAVERFIDRRQSDSSDETLQSYRYRLLQFVRWCEERGIMNVNVIDGRHIQEYLSFRQDELTRTTLNTQFGTIKKFFEFAVAIEAAEPSMPDKVQLLKPQTSKQEDANDLKLDADRAAEILDHLSRFRYASRDHALLLLMWRTGARMGALRGLDLDHFERDEQILRFRHEPDRGLPLKNKDESERDVALSEATTRVVADYVDTNREHYVDDDGRQPLLTTAFGRASKQTIRQTIYTLTQPCEIGDCPHDEEPETCQYREHGHQSKCPSSLSPHRIRTGAITNMREQGMPAEVVAERVDATAQTIRYHYDRSDPRKRAEQRRDHLEDLD
ncbi:tyrosine-type recombinase/integrase [Haloparvum sedimenti]|uniref:tyrosine-type recombinase/integrase n=1 Tax=Haloparvum sedimenti TaxID=1678448 RepID=UPI00071E6DF5|nr:site-specific integrase [Haloparvum sedimenti]